MGWGGCRLKVDRTMGAGKYSDDGVAKTSPDGVVLAVVRYRLSLLKFYRTF